MPVRVLTICCVLGAVLPACAGDWPTFRGTDRTAVSPETGLLQKWPAAGPPLLWKTEGAGRGYTSMAIKSGRMYVLGDGVADAPDTDEYLICYNVADGRRLWQTKLGAPWNEGKANWQSSRSTPSVDEARVYAVTPAGELVCCDAATGAELWRKNLKSDFGGSKADNWGYSESVLLDGDRLICTPGGDQNTMVALDKVTGETIWSVARAGDTGAGHSSIVISDVGGIKVYVQTTGAGALGVRDDGTLMWSYPIERTTAVAPTPIIRDDLVFFAAGYKRGGALLRQVAG
ncbi:MAG: PQQ-like beta-propeller repeat protein, partial [Planctomycetaceae bacterium]|nr:PQQ-like beta-propeller repeat protein [Planctomycetaceae bacterium]